MASIILALAGAMPAEAAPTPAGTPIGNQASATYTDGAGVTREVLSNPVITYVQQVAAVALTVDGTRFVAPGGQVFFPHMILNTGNGPDTFALSAANLGGDAFDLAGLAIYADADGNGQPDNFTPITITGPLAAGGVFHFVVAGAAPGGQASGDQALVLVTATSEFDNAVATTNTDTATATGNAVVSVTKAFGASSAAPGAGPLTVTLEYINLGQETATDVTVTDAIPAGLVYVAGSARWSGSAVALTDAPGGDPAGIVYDFGDTTPGMATAVIGAVAPTTLGTLQFEVLVDAAAPPGPIHNTAFVRYDPDGAGPASPTLDEPSNTATLQVTPAPGVVVNDDPLQPGDDTLDDIVTAPVALQGAPVSFANRVHNTGTGPQTFDITLSGSTFPVGTTFLLFQADGATPLADSGGSAAPDTGPVAAGATATVVVKAILPPSALGDNGGAGYSVIVTATAATDASVTDATTNFLGLIAANAVDLTNNDPVPGGLGAGAGPEPAAVVTNAVNPGATTRFVVHVNNASGQPDEFDLVASTDGTFGAVALPADWTLSFKDAAETPITAVGPIAGGGSQLIYVDVTVPADATPALVSLFFRARSAVSGAQDVLHNAVAVNVVRQLVLTPNNVGFAAAPGVVVYAHTLTNAGNVLEGDGAVSSVALALANDQAGFVAEVYFDADGNGVLDGSDPLVGDLSFVSDGGAGLEPGESVALLVKVAVPADATVGQVNVATVTATTTNGNYTEVVPAVASATDTTTVAPAGLALLLEQALDYDCDGVADESFATTPITAGAFPGVCVRYQLVVVNSGMNTVADLTVFAATPPHTLYTATGPAAASVGAVGATPADGAAGAVRFDIGSLAPGQTATNTFGARLDAPPADTVIENVATLEFRDAVSNALLQFPSNPVALTAAALPSDVTITFYRDDTFVAVAAAVPAGDPLYIAAFAPGCNLNPHTAETVSITVVSTLTGDTETLTGVESGPNTGVFRILPNLPTQKHNQHPLVLGDGIVNTRATDRLVATIAGCGVGSAEASVLVDPLGIVFDSVSNLPVANATITLLNALTGTPADVLEADGVTVAPNPVVTGADGAYQFPLVVPGTYRLLIQPPPTHTAPSGKAPSQLPAGRTIDVSGSYGGNFIVPANVDLVVLDVPVDPLGGPATGLFLQKQASRASAEIGDLVTYTIRVQNVSGGDLTGITVADALPAGFLFVKKSAALDGAVLADPSGTPGPNLTFDIGDLADGAIATLTYRTKVGPGAMRGKGVNTAQATATGPVVVASNLARAKVRLDRGVFTERGAIIGKVFVDMDGNRVQGGPGEVGVPGVRIYMQDGTYALTDSEGKFSFYGVHPRTHVLKVDPITLPAGAKLAPLATRHARSPGTRFVDLKNHELHKADFAIGAPGEAALAEIAARRAKGDPDVAEIQDGVRRELTPDSRPVPTADPKSLPAAGVLTSGNSNLMKAPVLPAARAPHPDPLPASGAKEFGFVDLRAGDTLPLAQANIRVAGQAGAALALQVNGAPVSERQLGQRTALPDQGLELAEYVGVALRPGANTLTLTQTDSFGNDRGRVEITVIAPDRLGKLRLEIPAGNHQADGHTPLLARVVLTDASGAPVSARTPVTLETSHGRWDARDLDEREPGVQVFIEGGVGEFALVPPGEPATAMARASSGALVAETEVAFTPHLRPMLAVGVIEGALNVNRLSSRSILPARKRDGFEEELRTLTFTGDNDRIQGGARAAFFLKGKVKGEYLLTAAYDSDKDTQSRLFRDIQPDEFYPIYGDSAVRGFDAQSSGRLYVRVDKNRSYLLYGDFQTGVDTPAVGLAQYNRSLTGVKEHFETERLTVDAWATYDTARQVVEELPANGTSGPYLFNTVNGLENSERVEILTRSANQPSLILRSVVMSRFVEYEFEPFTGRLLFKAPVPSLDENLNPISIRVTFEVEQGGKEFWVYGAAAQFKVTDGLSVGGTLARDENPLAAYELYSGNATLQLSPNTVLIGELAQSNADGVGHGWAGRLDLRHRSERLDARAYVAKAEEDFTNPNSILSSGRLEYGAKATYRLDAQTRVMAEGLKTSDDFNDVDRWETRASVERSFADRLRAELGLRHANERSGAAPREDLTSVRGRLTLPVWKLPTAAVYGEYEQDVTDAERQMAAVGGEYAFQNRGRLYARHEFISELGHPNELQGNRQQNTTVIGLDTAYMKDGQVFNEYRIRDGVAGRDAEAAMGLRNVWHIASALRLHTSFERINPLRGNTAVESTAGTLGVEYLPDADWKATGRVELRTSDLEDSFLTTLGYARKLDANWTMLARTITRLADVKTAGAGSKLQSRLQLGAAWRQTETNVWNALFKYEFKHEEDDTLAPGLDRYAHIFSGTANWQPTADLWASGTYAAKWAVDRGGATRDSGSAHLVAGRVLYDLTDRWDVGWNASALFDETLQRVQYGFGPEVGFVLMKNLRVGVGYNFFGYHDEDLRASEYTQRGVFITLRYKFDEALFGRRQEEN